MSGGAERDPEMAMRLAARPYRTPIEVERISVIHVRDLRGAGTEADPIREVHQYWSDAGELLAERDPHA